MKLPALTLAAIVVFGLAGCGDALTASPHALITPTPTLPPTERASAPVPGASTGLPSTTPEVDGLPHGALDLEAIVPDSFRDQPLIVVSYGPADLANSLISTIYFPIIDAAGADRSKVEIASGILSRRAAIQEPFRFMVMSVPGSDATRLVEAYVQTITAPVSVTKETRGGRPVTRQMSAAPEFSNDVWIVYAIDDVLFDITTADEAAADELIALLPRTSS